MGNTTDKITSDTLPSDHEDFLTFSFREIYEKSQNNSLLYDLLNDYESLLYKLPQPVVILLSFLYGFITILSILGNLIVIIMIFRSKRMKSVTNILICNLGFADLVIGVFAIPFHFQAALTKNWHLPNGFCKIFPFAEDTSVNVSTLTLSAIALDRYKAIMYPLKPKLSICILRIIIVIIWIIATAMSIPNILSYGVVMHTNKFNNETRFFCLNHKFSKTFIKFYTSFSVVLQYFLATIILIVVYFRIVNKLWKINIPGNPQHKRDHIFEDNRRKVIKMLLSIVILFCLCWLPFRLYQIVEIVYPEINRYKYINLIWFCVHWLAMSNSACNPFVYTICHENFRREFKMHLKCFKFNYRNRFSSPHDSPRHPEIQMNMLHH